MGEKQSRIFLKRRYVTQTVSGSQEVDKILIQLPHLLSNFAGQLAITQISVAAFKLTCKTRGTAVTVTFKNTKFYQNLTYCKILKSDS